MLKTVKLQEFYLLRKKDLSGLSGTGIVARGIELQSGRAVLEWLGKYKTITVFDNIQQIIDIHGHEGATELCLGSPPMEELK